MRISFKVKVKVKECDKNKLRHVSNFRALFLSHDEVSGVKRRLREIGRKDHVGQALESTGQGKGLYLRRTGHSQHLCAFVQGGASRKNIVHKQDPPARDLLTPEDTEGPFQIIAPGPAT